MFFFGVEEQKGLVYHLEGRRTTVWEPLPYMTLSYLQLK